MRDLVSALNRNKLFKFVSSVRLAIPLMLVLGAVVAWGTILESRYNAQVASIRVYQAPWFWGLLGLLWLNIFAAALSRYPFKKHQTGFVVTHVGMLTLLVGAFMTAQFGLDGQLRVLEGKSSSRVQVERYSIKLIDGEGKMASYPIPRKLREMGRDELGDVLPPWSGLVVERFVPFGVKEQTVRAGGGGGGAAYVKFRLRSGFFDVTESLQSARKPQVQMGPATIRLVSERTAPAKLAATKAPTHSEAKAPARPPARKLAQQARLEIADFASGEVLASVDPGKFAKSGWSGGGRSVKLVRVFKSAVVAGGKLTEREGAGPANPAVEVLVEKGGQAVREISFARHPEFAINAQGAHGLRIRYVVRGGEEEALAGDHAHSHEHQHQHEHEHGDEAAAGPGGNVVEFSPSKDASLTHVELYKNGQSVLSRDAKAGEEISTPWMGMVLTVLEAGTAGELAEEVRPIEMQERSPLPPSAIFLRPLGGGQEDGAWLIEGEYKAVSTPAGQREVYYGPEEVQLPFSLQLDQFRKVDYPGTNTALSFESSVRVNSQGNPIVISMNEPHLEQGYTLYQSSYEMGEGAPTASIFSVNRDPGRPVKYLGSLILCAGIAIYAAMKSRLARARKAAVAGALAALAALAQPTASHATPNALTLGPREARSKFVELASTIRSSEIAALPVQSHGRIKPFDTFARENILYLTGKYSFWGLDAIQVYLGLILSDAAPLAELINVRDPQVRKELELDPGARHFSAEVLSMTRLEVLSRPLLEKQSRNERSLSPHDKAVLEAVQQTWLLRGISSGEQLMGAVDLDPSPAGAPGHGAQSSASGPVRDKLRAYLGALSSLNPEASRAAAASLLEVARAQQVPELFKRSLGILEFEVLYNRARPFLYVGILYFLLGLGLMFSRTEAVLSHGRALAIAALPLAGHVAAFAGRVWITGFAPVTSMYGTMLWMAFGVVLFGAVLFGLYRLRAAFGILLLGASLTILLTESIPLVLSPDMDPVVAVLRSNFWLTIHVLTVTISYAAFTISMLIGNVALIRNLVPGLKPLSGAQLKQYSHLVYRSIQLGVFLLTSGIILGGVWADYSWGRFWGWDPKETWALIADLGYLVILHGRFVGWVSPFGMLAFSPAAYLLVVMAWYGVNFVLAAGLHSYGFSSGGAQAVGVFVALQVALLAAGWIKERVSRGPALSS